MYVCMYVCMYVRMYVCISMCYVSFEYGLGHLPSTRLLHFLICPDDGSTYK
jgi:hypothetical protein